MPLRAIPSAFDAATVAAIDSRLDAIEREHDVSILLAVESEAALGDEAIP